MKDYKIPDWLSDSAIHYSEEAIRREWAKREQSPANRAVRILVIAGILLASVLLISTLFAFQLHESVTVMFAVGTIGCLAGIWLNRKGQSEVVDTVAVSATLMGYGCLAFAAFDSGLNIHLSYFLLLLISVFFTIFPKGFVLPFLGTVSFCIVLLVWITDQKQYLITPVIYTLLAGGLLCAYLFEGYFLGWYRKLSRQFDPLRLGSLISVLITLYVFTPFYIPSFLTDNPYPNYQLYFSVPASLLCLYSVYHVLQQNRIISGTKWGILLATGLILSLTLFAPAISLSLLLLILTFYGGHATGIVLAAISMCFAIGLYYYDLHFSLLIKSFLLMGSGLLFLGGYWMLHQQNKKDVKDR